LGLDDPIREALMKEAPLSIQISTDPQVQLGLAFLQDLMSCYSPRDFAVRFWNGTVWEADAGQPTRFTLVLNHPGALRRMFLRDQTLKVPESYIFGDYDVEGDLAAFLSVLRDVKEHGMGLRDMLRLGWRLFRMPRMERPRVGRQPAKVSGKLHSPDRDRVSIDYHYGLPPEFYSTFLDPHLAYSCGYYHSPDEDLKTAQERKLEVWCRKLRLQPGDRVADIGCGWGSFTVYAAKNHGVNIFAVTNNPRQAEHVRERVKREGLENRVEVFVGDYREIGQRDPFDKIILLEAAEHFGTKGMATFFQLAWNMLKPGGLIGNQEIGRLTGGPAFGALRRYGRFNHRYVFPDGELRPLSVTLNLAERVGFEVRSVECFRDHYMLTLQHWTDNLEKNHDEAVRVTDEVTYRIFRMYLAGALHGMQRGNTSVHHTLLVKSDERGRSHFPLTPWLDWDR